MSFLPSFNFFGNKAGHIIKKIIIYYSKTVGGRYFKNDIFSDQIEVFTESLRDGKVSVRDLHLNTECINSQFAHLPFELVEGYISRVDADVPLYQFFEADSNINVVIHGAEITIKPKQAVDDGLDVEQMFDSMVSSMHAAAQESTAQIAEECRKEVAASNTEGAEVIAAFINNGMKKLKVTLEDTIARVEYKPAGAEKGVGLEIHIKHMEFYDDSVGKDGVGGAKEGMQGGDLLAWDSAKVFTLSGVTILMDDVVQAEVSRKSESDDSMDLEKAARLEESAESMVSSQMFQSARSSLAGESSKSDSSEPPPLPQPVQVAMLTGQQVIKLRLRTQAKQTGPKLELDAQLGALHVLLAPQQFHGLLSLVEGFSSPESSGGASGRGQRDKPMGAADFALVEQTLQSDLTHGDEPLSTSPYMSGRLNDYDPMTASCYGEEMFASMHQGPAYAESVMTQSSSSVYSNTTNRSTGTSATGNTFTDREFPERSAPIARSPHDNLQKLAEDPAAEFSRYHLKVGFISINLLHENPVGPSGEQGTLESLRSISQTFFSKAPSIAYQGLQLSTSNLRTDYSNILPYDHIGFLAKPLTLECSQGSAPKLRSLKVDLTLGIFDVAECLFDRRNCTASLKGFHLPIDHKLPDYIDLLVFRDVEGTQTSVDPFPGQTSLQATVPAVHLKMVSTMHTKGSSRHYQPPCTSVEVMLKEFYSELDITIVDRLSALLKHSPSLPRRCADLGPAYTNNGQLTSMCFNQVMDEGQEGEDKKLELKVSTCSGVIDIRFPIPDLRTSPADGFAWWQRNLHEEVLTIETHNLCFDAKFGNSHCTTLTFSGSDMDVYFKQPSDKAKVLIAQVTSLNNTGDPEEGLQGSISAVSQPRVEIVMYPTVSLLETTAPMYQDPGESSMREIIDTPQYVSSPFSQRREFYHKVQDAATGESASGKEPGTDVMKKVLPGDKAELQKWQDTESSHTKLHIQVSLPQVTAYLPSKQLFEVLYNRINNDLLMWEPLAPAPLTQDALYPGHASIHILHLLQQQGHTDTYEETEEQESESDDDTMPFMSGNFNREQTELEEGHMPQRQSKAVFSLAIGQGKLLANVSIEGEEKKHGEILLSLEDALLFSVVGHNGDSDLRQLSFQANHARVLHNGCVMSRIQTPGNVAVVREEGALAHLESAIYKASRGVLENHWSKVGTGPQSEDMVTVAVEIRLHPVDNMKDVTVAVGVNCGTMRHRVVPSPHDLIHQVIEFLDVQDYPIMGYVDPKVVTAFHLHLTKCSVDYRPLYLPYKALLKAESVSLNTNIVASSSKATAISLHLDEAALFLAKRGHVDGPEVNLRNEYIYAAGVDTFGFCIKFNPCKDAPKKEVTIDSRRLEILTCVDSARALLQMGLYLARGGDLTPADDPSNLLSNTLSGSEDSGHSSLGGGTCGLTDYELQHVVAQMEDAMIESGHQGEMGEEELQMEEGAGEMNYAGGGYTASPMQGSTTLSRSSESMTSSVSEEHECGMEDDDDFVLITSPGHRGNEDPVIVDISKKPIEIKDNFFTKPLTPKDLLKAPDDFPIPENTFTVKEMTIVWSLFGGKDFDRQRSSAKKTRTIPVSFDKSDWKMLGGPQRDLCKLMEFQLTKMRFQNETYPNNTEQASRSALSLEEVEVRSRMQGSSYNKVLSLLRYHEDIILHTNTPMVVIKALFTRPEPGRPMQECSLKVSCQPIKLNIDQIIMKFLRDYYTELNEGDKEAGEGRPESASPRDSARPSLSCTPPAPYMTVENPVEPPTPQPEPPAEQPPLMSFDETTGGGSTHESVAPPVSPEQEYDQPIFFKSFVFTPEVPIVLAYSGKGQVENSNIVGYVAGFVSLNKTHLKLKRINFQNGFLGFQKLVDAILHEWGDDVAANQMSDIALGLGFLPIISQFISGIKNLVVMPVEQYQRDGRWVCGLQRGVHSFSTMTLMSIIEVCTLTSRSLQFLLECTYDLVSPHDSVKNRTNRKKKLIRRGQPADIREGVNAAITVVKEDSVDIYNNLKRAVNENRETKGVAGAVGGVARELLPTTVKPFIMLTDASSTVLDGIRNQIRPAAKKEDEDKWREEEETVTITE